MDLGDYWAILKRRKWMFIGPALVVGLIALTLAVVLPPVYRSTATILIERQEIPEDLVETTVTGYVQERIQGLKQRLLTHERLWNIAQKYHLYADRRKEMTEDDVVQEMQDNITVEMVDVQASNPGTGRNMTATVAFTVSFAGPNAENAKKVTDELANMYLEEDRRARTQQTKQVTQFLEQEAHRLENRISDLEGQLADFKQEHVDTMPSMSDMNLRLFQQTQDSIQSVEDRIRTLQERKVFLQSQLATTSPYAPMVGDEGQRVLNPEERLNVLEAQYARLKSIYSANHPDVERLKTQIHDLKKQLGDNGEAAALYQQLDAMNQKLAEMRQRYSPQYPDVKRLKRSIAELQDKIKKLPARSQDNRALKQPPDNPAYIQLRTQMDAMNVSINAAHDELRQLQQKADELQKRIRQTPEVEKKYLSLSRDYKNAVDKYNEVTGKIAQARAAVQLELQNKGERFALVGKPRVADTPESPNRLGIVLLGIVLGMGAGLGGAAISEYFDRTVRGVRGVVEMFGAPPLASIPYIDNDRDVRHRRVVTGATVGGIALVLAVTLGAVHTFYKPLDQIWGEFAEGTSPVSVTAGAATSGADTGKQK